MRVLWKLYGVYGVFLIVAAFFSEGWQQPDEHARVLEAAHQVAYGYATLAWEFNSDHPIVSMFLGVIHAPILMLTRSLSLDGATEASIMRAFAGLVAATRFFAFYVILQSMGFSFRYRRMGTLLYAFSIFGPMLFLRTSQENYATTALVWALYCLLTARSRSKWILFGIFLSVSASCRLQAGFACLGLLVAFVMREPDWKRWGKWVAGGLLLGLLPMALVDISYTGMPFTPAWNYLQYALSNEDGGLTWGNSPWYFYGKEYFLTWFPPFSIVLAPLILHSLAKNSFLLFPVLFFSVVHVILGHKEVRYFTPMVPFFFLASFDGLRRFCSSFKINHVRQDAFFNRTWVKMIFGLYATVGIVAAFIPLNTSPRLYQELARRQQVSYNHYTFTYVGNTRSGISQFYYKYPNSIPPEQWTLPEFLHWMYGITPKFLAYLEEPDSICPETRHFALYAFRFHELHEVLRYCDLEFVPLPKSVFYFLLDHEKWVANQRIHAIVRCSKKPNFSPK